MITTSVAIFRVYTISFISRSLSIFLFFNQNVDLKLLNGCLIFFTNFRICIREKKKGSLYNKEVITIFLFKPRIVLILFLC